MNSDRLCNFEKLKCAVIVKSEANTWNEAKKEWKIIDIEDAEEPEECICGHYPIKEVMILKNIKNYSELRVGNHCINRFFCKNSLFDGYKKIKQSPDKSTNLALLEFARRNSWISSKDYGFYIDIISKRKLSSKQQKWKNDINNKIASRIKARK